MFKQSTYLFQMVGTEKADPKSQSAESIQVQRVLTEIVLSHNTFWEVWKSEKIKEAHCTAGLEE